MGLPLQCSLLLVKEKGLLQKTCAISMLVWCLIVRLLCRNSLSADYLFHNHEAKEYDVVRLVEPCLLRPDALIVIVPGGEDDPVRTQGGLAEAGAVVAVPWPQRVCFLSWTILLTESVVCSFEAMVNSFFDNARNFADLVKKDSELELAMTLNRFCALSADRFVLVREPESLNVCFFYLPPSIRSAC